MPQLRQLDTGFSPHHPKFNPQQPMLNFKVDEVELEQISFPQFFSFSLLIILSLLHTPL
jgi:hypothetical protein